jgi:hypothetical protein
LRALEAFKAGRFRLSRDEDVAVSASALLAKHNTKRVRLVVTNHGAAHARIGFKPFATADTGIPVPANGGQVQVVIEEDGEAVAQEVYAISAGAAVSLHVLEWSVE